MNKQKRYAIKADFYIYAKDEKEAKTKADKWAEGFRGSEDNQARVLGLDESKFGQIA